MDIKAILAAHAKWLDDPNQAGAVWADLSGSNLSGSNLSGSDLRGSDLSGSSLSGSDLSGSDLRWSDLRWSDLRGSDLSGSDLRGSDLSRSNLSGVTGLLSAADWMQDTFQATADGYIVYRARCGAFRAPDAWRFEPGAVLTEVVNPTRTDDCGCGVHFATREWVKAKHPDQPCWRCLLRWADLPDVVVPYNTDGKARCGRLELIESSEFLTTRKAHACWGCDLEIPSGRRVYCTVNKEDGALNRCWWCAICFDLLTAPGADNDQPIRRGELRREYPEFYEAAT